MIQQSFDLHDGDGVTLRTTPAGRVAIIAFDADNGFEAEAWATPDQAVAIGRCLIAAGRGLDRSIPAVAE